MKKINKFKDEYGFLSNFYHAPIKYDGIIYQNNEAAFQAQKTLDKNRRLEIAKLTPSQAKIAGNNVVLRPDWEIIKTQIMYDICMAKFTQNEDLKKKLVNTGYAYLEEGNHWNDTCWGVCNGKGENRLGFILMHIRMVLALQINDTTFLDKTLDKIFKYDLPYMFYEYYKDINPLKGKINQFYLTNAEMYAYMNNEDLFEYWNDLDIEKCENCEDGHYGKFDGITSFPCEGRYCEEQYEEWLSKIAYYDIDETIHKIDNTIDEYFEKLKYVQTQDYLSWLDSYMISKTSVNKNYILSTDRDSNENIEDSVEDIKNIRMLDMFLKYVDQCAKEQNIPNIINPYNCYEVLNYIIRINNNFYNISIMIGQGSIVFVEKKNKPNCSYVDMRKEK